MTKLLLAFLAALPSLQAAPETLAGTWVADLNGTTVVRLELRTVSGRVAGELGTGNIRFGKNGMVESAESAPTTLTPISPIEITRGAMSFTRVEGNDVERFRIRVTGNDTAELTFLPSEEDLAELEDAGVPPPKPIALRKLR